MMMCEGKQLEAHAQQAESPSPGPRRWARLKRTWAWLPRLETSILALGLVSNLLGKYAMLRRGPVDDPLFTALQVSLSDLAFFGCVALLIVLARAVGPWKLSSRFAVVLALVVSGWSLANMAWLAGAGVQIHVGVIANLIRDPMEFGPIVTNGLANRPGIAIRLATVGPLVCLVVLWRLIRPEPLRRPRLRRAVHGVLAAAIVAGSSGLDALRAPFTSADPQRAALAYSSHWLGLTTLLGLNETYEQDEDGDRRRIARQGERHIPPLPAGSHQPHVVMIVMESVAHWATPFGDQPEARMPMLAELARQGTLFENTHSVARHTTQSQFSMLTGVPPSLEGGFAETVLVDPPYETLTTILRASGYRTRFSQMVRATFECNPGLVANLGFESFWSREDLQDPDAHLGYFAGDDFRMIDPAFAWFDRQADPCFMLFMTSVAHHPYEVPDWYGPEIEDDKQAFLQTVRYTDAFVKEVVDELEDRGVFGDTLLCVISDHGEGFGEHNILQHGENPYEEALRIPWVITWPKRLSGGKVVKEPCSVLDVTPTILSMLGFDVTMAGFEGLDAMSGIPADRKLSFWGWEPVDPAGFIQGHDKVVYWPSLDRAYRYDLSKDPNEIEPTLLGDGETEQVRSALAAWRNSSRITFDPKRYRERFLFGCWRTSCLGNVAWCYYVPREEEGTP